MGFGALTVDSAEYQPVPYCSDQQIHAHIENIGKATGHTSTKVVTSGAQHGDNTTGHIFTAVIAGTFNYR